ncbi:unnamed protein product [Rhizophagus irregularis]|nr:unnamed protein product [Rhizophagus irregularis]
MYQIIFTIYKNQPNAVKLGLYSIYGYDDKLPGKNRITLKGNLNESSICTRPLTICKSLSKVHRGLGFTNFFSRLYEINFFGQDNAPQFFFAEVKIIKKNE